jgi:hypothetical protein
MFSAFRKFFQASSSEKNIIIIVKIFFQPSEIMKITQQKFKHISKYLYNSWRNYLSKSEV